MPADTSLIDTLTPTDSIAFNGAYELSETVRDQIRAILAASTAPGTFSYEPALNEDDEVDEIMIENPEAVAEEDYDDVVIEILYWDIVYRSGDIEIERFQVEFDDEVDWWFDRLDQAGVDTLAAVLRLLLEHKRIELID